MEKKNLDNSFDYLTVFVKRDKLEEVEERYRIFSWEILEKSEHERFGNIVVIKLRRPHKIENKDKLQFLQVQMEFLLNSEAKLEKNKHLKSTCFGIFFGLLCALAISLSVLMVVRGVETFQIVLGSIFIVLSVVLNVILFFVVLKMAKCEDAIFKKKSEVIKQKLDEVCDFKSTSENN